ncbi:hypothetical protein HYDPIDRAFT_35911 [Hydnomerulius pinastri MD-312]|nr:hypothetical protein HYDPIDRAFT_35911 [Hydnomerulius pinastri MD-312]
MNEILNVNNMQSISNSTSRPPRPTRSVPETPETTATTATTGTSTIPETDPPDDTKNTTALTPLRAHYLKKSLIQLQFHKELDDITNAPADNASTLSYLGPPFSPPPKGSKRLHLPFLRYIFRQFVLTFPFMAAAPENFYSDKLQPFVASVFARNLSPTMLLDDVDGEESSGATRLKMLGKVERNLAMFFGSGTKLVEPEEVVRLTQADLDRLERAVKRRQAKKGQEREVFEVNIVCVRSVTDKGRVRSRVHEEFIIRTRLSQDREVCVSRRYGDFKTLADELRKAHPDELVPSPPAKDRTSVDVPMSPSPSPLYPLSSLSATSNGTFSEENASQDSFLQSPSIPGGFYPSGSASGYGSSSWGSGYGGGAGYAPQPPRLSRERNRLTLRSYLHTLLQTSPFSSSPVLRSFLLSGPTRLTPEEHEDARRREEADRVREEGRKRFAREVGGRVDGLREAVRSVKGEVVGRDGLTHVFATIKVTSDVRDLPENYQAVIEWARISLASTIFQTFVAADNSSETFASLKRIHGLMPYFVLKTALRVSNPVAMVRKILDIFMAQPFGGKSLLQRMFTSSLTEEVKSLTTYIALVSAKIDEPVLCEKIRLFVYAPREIQDMYRVDAQASGEHLLRVVLRGGEEPVMGRALGERVERAGKKWEEWLTEKEARGGGAGAGGAGAVRGDDDSDDEGPGDEEAWLFEDLKVLVRLYSRLRDREQLIALIFEGSTAELLKDIITIFYTPLAQVYRAASIADSLGDLQNFITDLIHTVEQTEDLSQSDPSQTVQAFIDLVNRHEQAFYSFVHNVHSKGSSLFDSLMRWIERFLTVIREGIGAPSPSAPRASGDELGAAMEAPANRIALETVLPAGGEDRLRIMEEVDRVARWHYANKIAHEDKVRRRFGRAQAQGGADEEDEATQALVHGVVGEINFGELVSGDADELAAEASDEEDEDDEEESDEEGSSEYETDSEGSYEETSTEESLPEKSPGSPAPSARPPTAPTRSSSTITPAAASPIARPKTEQPQRRPTQTSQSPSPPQKPPAIRQRSLSLRSARSITFSPQQFHSSQDAPPPVPPLPPRFEKTLPAPPGGRPSPGPPPLSAGLQRRRSTDHLPKVPVGNGRAQSPPQPQSQSQGKQPQPRPPRKPKRGLMEPPELKYIPTLLPVFVEMMLPLLPQR